MKKIFAAALLTVFSFYGSSVLAGPPCDKKPSQDSCIAECEADSTLSWCSTLCSDNPDAGYSWCATDSGGGDASANSSCPPAYDIVPPVTEAQAQIIMQSHYCEDMTVQDLSVMFMSAGLTETQIQAQIDATK